MLKKGVTHIFYGAPRFVSPWLCKGETDIPLLFFIAIFNNDRYGIQTNDEK